MHILESGEDYLESILIIKNEKGFVRSIDIVQHLGYSKPSVSIAMKKLRDNGYINIDDKGLISLTEEGNKIANTIYERHQVITNVLIKIGVNKEQALIDACKIEHDISEETFNAIKKHIK
mgnify:CR=1 FL=1